MIPTRIQPESAATGADPSCNVDRSRAPGSGCGCDPSAESGTAPTESTSRRGLKAALLAVACMVVCLVVSLSVGGVAALSAALAGEWWLVAGVVAVAAIASVVLVRRRNGRIC